jgi:FkbM family methyltransferase
VPLVFLVAINSNSPGAVSPMTIKSFAKSVTPRTIWSLLRRCSDYRQLRLYKRSITACSPRVVRHVYGGFPLDICIADPTAERWYCSDWPLPAELAFMQSHRLVPGAKVFDLGAHQSVVALMMARIVGPTGFVLAVEGNAHNAEISRRNCELNGVSHLQVVSAAVSDRPGTLYFNERLNGQVACDASWGRVAVEAVTVDQLSARFGMPDILYIDVEGYECNVLKGATSTLQHGADCFVEVHVGVGLEQLQGSTDEILRSFPSDRYELFVASGSDASLEPSFVPLGADTSVFSDRFFLIALRRKDS